MRALIVSMLLGLAACDLERVEDLGTISARVDATEFFVEADGGSDTNDCSASAPCLTIQRAADQIPEDVTGGYRVKVGRGSYAGLVLAGKDVQPGRAGSASFIDFEGTLISPDLTTGTASGTITSFTAASGGIATVMDSSQNWATNALKGMLFEFVSGPGSSATARFVIQSNTADTVKIAAFASTSATAGSTTYAIKDHGTFIDTPVTGDTGAPFNLSPWGAAGIKVSVTAPAPGPNPIVFEKMAVRVSGATHFSLFGPNRVMLLWVKLVDGGSGAGYGVENFNDGTTCHHCFCSVGTFGSCVTSSAFSGSGRSLHVSRSVLEGGSVTVTAAGGNLIQSSYFGANSGAACLVAGAQGIPSQVQVTASTFDGCTRALYVSNSSGGGGIGQFGVQSSVVKNSTVAGVFFASQLATADLLGLSGTGNAIGIWVSEGGHANCTTGCTITGTTADFQVDGVNYSQATLRSNSPKVVPQTASPYGSAIYE